MDVAVEHIFGLPVLDVFQQSATSLVGGVVPVGLLEQRSVADEGFF